MLRAAVLEHEKKYPHYMPSYAIELAVLTGMRVGEIAALSWSAIDEKYICVTQAERRLDYSDRTSEIIIGKPKNGKIRRIPLTPEMKELFQKIRALGHPDREGFVFTEESGKRCKAHNISCAIARRCVDAGIEGKPIHGVRRTVSPCSARSFRRARLQTCSAIWRQRTTSFTITIILTISKSSGAWRVLPACISRGLKLA